LVSRTGKNLTEKYGPVAEALSDLRVEKAVLDGEIVAVDAAGRSSFQLLQRYQQAGREKPALLYYVFDLLNLEGRDCTGLLLTERKKLAEGLVREMPPIIRFSSSIESAPQRLLRELQARGLEGLVAKKKGVPLSAGPAEWSVG